MHPEISAAGDAAENAAGGDSSAPEILGIIGKALRLSQAVPLQQSWYPVKTNPVFTLALKRESSIRYRLDFENVSIKEVRGCCTW
jgi:hypothetical protein